MEHIENGMKIEEIFNEDKNEFIVTNIENEDGKIIIFRSKKMISYKGARFRFNIQFYNGIIEHISIVAAKKQENDIYEKCKDEDEVHKLWLLNNYGVPTLKEQFGYIYLFSDGKICSEYDPRSGSSEIIFIMHS